MSSPWQTLKQMLLSPWHQLFSGIGNQESRLCRISCSPSTPTCVALTHTPGYFHASLKSVSNIPDSPTCAMPLAPGTPEFGSINPHGWEGSPRLVSLLTSRQSRAPIVSSDFIVPACMSSSFLAPSLVQKDIQYKHTEQVAHRDCLADLQQTGPCSARAGEAFPGSQGKKGQARMGVPGGCGSRSAPTICLAGQGVLVCQSVSTYEPENLTSGGVLTSVPGQPAQLASHFWPMLF